MKKIRVIKNGSINVIDLIVIIVVIAALAGLCIRFLVPKKNSLNMGAEYEFKVKVENVRTPTIDALKKENLLINSVYEEKIGKIVDIEVTSSEFESVEASGNLIVTELPERNNLIITIRAEGFESPNGYLLSDDTPIYVGNNFSVITKYCSSTGKIISITKI